MLCSEEIVHCEPLMKTAACRIVCSSILLETLDVKKAPQIFVAPCFKKTVKYASKNGLNFWDAESDFLTLLIAKKVKKDVPYQVSTLHVKKQHSLDVLFFVRLCSWSCISTFSNNAVLRTEKRKTFLYISFLHFVLFLNPETSNLL